MVNAMEIDSQYETTENACVTTMRSQQHSSPAPPSEELRQTGRNTAVALVNAVSLLDNICGSLTTMYQRGGLGRARFHRSARDLEDCPPVRGEWASGASANSRCGNICDFCDPRLVLACVLEDGVPGSGVLGAVCGGLRHKGRTRAARRGATAGTFALLPAAPLHLTLPFARCLTVTTPLSSPTHPLPLPFLRHPQP